MLNRQAEPSVSTSIPKAMPGKFDIKITHLVFSIIFTAMPFHYCYKPFLFQAMPFIEFQFKYGER